MDFFNSEHYADPTAYAALSQIERAERFRPLVYICSPFSCGNVEQNIENVRKYCRFAVDKHCIPIAPHLLFPQFMNEDTERETALFMGIVLLTKCAEIWYSAALFQAEWQWKLQRHSGKVFLSDTFPRIWRSSYDV